MQTQGKPSSVNIPSSQIILINIIGPDRAGISAGTMEVLKKFKANVLDIGQSVIHNYLNLGVLAQFPANQNLRTFRERLQEFTHSNNLNLNFIDVTDEQYQAWVDQQGHGRHIVTLLAKAIKAEYLAEVASIAWLHGLNINNIIRRSGRVPLHKITQQSLSCIEFSARGEPKDLPNLRADLMKLAQKFDVDIAVQEDSIFRRSRRLVCFDMDSTLIQTEVIDELANIAGVGKEVAEITQLTMSGKLDFNQSLRHRVGLLKGIDASILETIIDKVKLTDGAEKLISTLNKLGYKTAILSGGFDFLAKELQKKLNINFVFANHLEIKEGVLTGKTTGDIINGEKKAEILKQLALSEGIHQQQVIAVGDGANDLPMLNEAGLGIAFRAKPIVKASAQYSISQLGLDAILYLIGFSDRDIAKLNRTN